MAAQDQSLYTRHYKAKIIKNGAHSKCKMCDQFDETDSHLVSGSPVVSPTEYKNKHDKVGQYIHWKIYYNITKPHTMKTGMDINQNLLLKQRVPQSFEILQYIQTEKLTPMNLILQLKIIKTTPVYWLS